MHTRLALRNDITSGERIAARVEAHMLLQNDDGSKKDNLYVVILSNALALRDVRTGTNNRYRSYGFLDAITEALVIENSVDVRRAFRAMRVELISEQEKSTDGDVQEVFLSEAKKYIYHYTTGANTSPNIITLQQVWDGVSLTDFYRKFYQVTRMPQTRGTWNAYEAAVLHVFYEKRILAGSHLSELDKLVLELSRYGIEQGVEVEGIRTKTGVPYDISITDIHRRALLKGSF